MLIYVRALGPKRISMYSGVVLHLDDMYTGVKKLAEGDKGSAGEPMKSWQCKQPTGWHGQGQIGMRLRASQEVHT
jgi:hypothetical protein